MYTIQLDTKLKDLKGKEIEVTVGSALSNVLISDKTGGKMKLFTLAQKCENEKSISLDDADFNLVKECTKRSEIWTSALVPGQLEILLESIKKA